MALKEHFYGMRELPLKAGRLGHHHCRKNQVTNTNQKAPKITERFARCPQCLFWPKFRT